MKKVSTAAVKQSKNFSQQKLTIGLDLGDRTSWYCVLDPTGSVLLEQQVSTSAQAMREVFGGMPCCRIALETGMHSPWVSRLLSELGHEVVVAHARNVRLIGESRPKDDRVDAQTLARLAMIDPELLSPVKHRSAKAQADLNVIRARAGLVRARTALVNTARGLAKSYGERLRGCNVRNMNPEKAEELSPELRRAVEPLLAGIESQSERIREYNERIEGLAQESYPQVALLKQVKGVGTLIALTFLLTLEDTHRFRKSRDVGCYLGLQPGRRNSGQSEPQMHIKEGDPYLRTLLVQGAQHILGPFGADCDLRRWKSLGRLYWTHKRQGFYGWHIARRYSAAETRAAKLHLFQISATVRPSGEECGTVYDDGEMCPLCGCGRVQVSPLRLRLAKTPKRAEIAQSWGGETIVSARVVRLLIDSAITGFGLGPVQRSKKGTEEPFSFSQTDSGRQLLHVAEQQGVKYPSPEFYIWINGLKRRDLFQRAVKEHEGMKLARRRLGGGTSPHWYQLFVISNAVELASATLVGNGPFDNDLQSRQRCPLGLRDHVLGLNLLSQVSLPSSEWDGIDFLRSRGPVGVRRGLFMPRPLLFISARLRELLLQNSIKGWASEVVNLSPNC